MDLIKFLPSSSKLKPGAFRSFNNNEQFKKLILEVKHNVTATFQDRDVYGQGMVQYHIQARVAGHRVSDKLTLNPGLPRIAFQTPSVIGSLMDEYRPKSGHNLRTDSPMYLDFRALIAVCGMFECAGATGAVLSLGGEKAHVKPLQRLWSPPGDGDVVITPNVTETDSDFVTLCYLLKLSGANTAVLLHDHIPTGNARVHSGQQLASFCGRVAAIAIGVMNDAGVGAHGLEAQFRGYLSFCGVWAHSDEGGWLDNAIGTIDYPPSCGVLHRGPDTIVGVSQLSRAPTKDVTRIFLSRMLTFMGMLVSGDADENGMMTTFSKQPDSLPRPSSFDGLSQATYRLLYKWRLQAEDKFSLTSGNIMDSHSMRSFFTNDATDEHFNRDNLIPFDAIEVSPLLTSKHSNYRGVGYSGGLQTLPWCKDATVFKSDIVVERKGVVVGGNSIFVKCGPGSVRDNGFQLLMSSDYRRENGLGLVNYVARPDLGTFTTDAAYVDRGSTNAAGRRWVAPHKTTPSVMEGYSTLPLSFQVEYMGNGKEAPTSFWENGSVDCSFTPFTIVRQSAAYGRATSRYVPEFIKDYILSASGGINLISVEEMCGVLRPHVHDPVVMPGTDVVLAASNILPEMDPQDIGPIAGRLEIDQEGPIELGPLGGEIEVAPDVAGTVDPPRVHPTEGGGS